MQEAFVISSRRQLVLQLLGLVTSLLQPTEVGGGRAGAQATSSVAEGFISRATGDWGNVQYSYHL